MARKKPSGTPATKPLEAPLPDGVLTDEETVDGGEEPEELLDLEDELEEVTEVDAEELPEAGETVATPEGDQASFDALYEEATFFRIKGRAKMSLSELTSAVALAREGQVEPQDLEPEDDPTLVNNGAPAQQITQQEARTINQGKTEDLEMVVSDPNLPPHLKSFIQSELAKRKTLQAEAAVQSALRSQMERFVVTKGGRYVSKEGFVTELPTGGLVTPATHDLRHVAQQGIEFRACGEPSTEWDELGRPRTKVNT